MKDLLWVLGVVAFVVTIIAFNVYREGIIWGWW